MDNDIIPAKESGMRAILIRRGPWSIDAEAGHADAIIDDLLELNALIATF